MSSNYANSFVPHEFIRKWPCNILYFENDKHANRRLTTLVVYRPLESKRCEFAPFAGFNRFLVLSKTPLIRRLEIIDTRDSRKNVKIRREFPRENTIKFENLDIKVFTIERNVRRLC